jgi:ankyrin repeat protein
MVCLKQLTFPRGLLKSYAVDYLDGHAARISSGETMAIGAYLEAHPITLRGQSSLWPDVPVKYVPVEEQVGLQALHVIVCYGWENLIRKWTGNVDAKDFLGRTPLMYAIIFNQHRAVQVLIERGANVNASNDHGRTPLSYAAGSLRMELAEILLSCGANVNQADKWNETPLFYALLDPRISRASSAERVHLQPDEDPFSWVYYRSNRPIPDYGLLRISMLRALVAAGANIDCADYRGISLLMYAASWELGENSGAVSMLLEYGANVNLADADGQTALIWIARRHGSLNLDLLIKKGAQIDHADKDGATALMHSSQCGMTHHMEALIRAGANMDLQDGGGLTAVMHVVKTATKSDDSRLDILLQNGCDINLKDKLGRTVLHHAAQSADVSVFPLLLRAFNSVNDGVNLRDQYGQTALMYAAERPDYDLIMKRIFPLLLDAGANIHLADNYGRTALWYAAYRQRRRAVAILVKAGADIHHADAEGQTPWSFAVIPGYLGRSAVKAMAQKFPEDFSDGMYY